jgi:hypothetical protein
MPLPTPGGTRIVIKESEVHTLCSDFVIPNVTTFEKSLLPKFDPVIFRVQFPCVLHTCDWIEYSGALYENAFVRVATLCPVTFTTTVRNLPIPSANWQIMVLSETKEINGHGVLPT